ncbi:MAG TPA: YfcE family phosphodiesterase [Clostridiales bacterium]|jgi:putative phosphoesterase|nr:YfcE family phosphodiesterase [Clostridiales bacterium]
MTKILVISDSHGSVKKIEKALADNFSCKYLIFLGDGTDDIKNAEDLNQNRIKYVVRGNCDRLDYFNPLLLTANIDGVKFYITHGHQEKIKEVGTDIIESRAMSEDCDIALFGHTHSYANIDFCNLKLLNPGSIRDNNCYLVLTVDNGKLVDIERKTL